MLSTLRPHHDLCMLCRVEQPGFRLYSKLFRTEVYRLTNATTSSDHNQASNRICHIVEKLVIDLRGLPDYYWGNASALWNDPRSKARRTRCPDSDTRTKPFLSDHDFELLPNVPRPERRIQCGNAHLVSLATHLHQDLLQSGSARRCRPTTQLCISEHSMDPSFNLIYPISQ